jgi:hypothetical protein
MLSITTSRLLLCFLLMVRSPTAKTPYFGWPAGATAQPDKYKVDGCSHIDPYFLHRHLAELGWVEEDKRQPRRPAYFLRNEHPSVSLALPPVGWQSTVEQPAQMTTV